MGIENVWIICMNLFKKCFVEMFCVSINATIGKILIKCVVVCFSDKANVLSAFSSYSLYVKL